VFLANPKTDVLVRCSEKQQKHTNLYKVKEGCCRKRRVGLCRRAWGILNVLSIKNVLGTEGAAVSMLLHETGVCIPCKYKCSKEIPADVGT